MGDGLRTIHVITSDETLRAQALAAAERIGGWELRCVDTVDELFLAAPVAGDVILLDKWLRGGDVYETCRGLSGRSRCRTFIVGEHDNRHGEAIARFCGATGMIRRPLNPSALEAAISESGGRRPQLSSERRGSGDAGHELPEKLLVELGSGRPDHALVSALTDPETSLFNYAFLNYKLDEEFKRAQRFGDPLSCVMLGFEGQAGSEVIAELAGLILSASRDTDVLGRFDENSFLFLLPRTGPDGARIMAQRVGEAAQERGLSDLVGDPLVISVGISCCPHPEIQRREDLFEVAREAFVDARTAGGGVITCA